jgi:methionyl-tRNA formyltransferase
MGTPAFAVPSLRALAAHATVVGVVSQPDKPQGRGLARQTTPVAAAARALDLPLVQPASLRGPEGAALIAAWKPDLLVVAAYGKILSQAILDLPTLGPVNVHASLLPRHRGAAPIAAAIAAGDARTGITIMRMTPELDAGDMLLQRALEIAPTDTCASLTERLAALGGETLVEALALLRGPGLAARPQDPAAVTWAPRLERDSGRIDWSEPAETIARKVRAFTPWPGSFTRLGDRTVKVLAARATEEPARDPAGTVVAVDDESMRVATGAGVLALLDLQMEGKKRLAAGAFARGARLAPGSRFDA